MAFLIEIGVGVVRKLAGNIVIRQVSYIVCYNKNLKKLQNKVGELVEARISMQHAVEIEERRGKKIETGVENWLTKVDRLTTKVDDFLKDEHHAGTKCLRGFCLNINLRHRLSRKSTKLVEEVAELYNKKFDNISYDAFLEEVCLAAIPDYDAFNSRTSTAKDVINELRKADTYLIGVYGIGGVGKTTLVKEVYKQIATGGEKLFDEIIMVLDLKDNLSIDRIQKEIAEKLGLELSETETPARKARQICNRIKDKKSLVILDDIWEKIDLEAVGLPHMATLKILLTARSKVVLSSHMGTQREFPLEVLDKDEAWSLFQKTVGDVVKDPDIETIATQVAEKCGGLPLLIVNVARSLKRSGLHAWKDTLRRLRRLDEKELVDKTYSSIEWSYNSLDNKELKSLFVLCGVVVDTVHTFFITDLWKYSMGLGLFKDVDTIGEAWDALMSMIELLKDSCLLLESDDNKFFRMHDLVKDVAKRIASREQHVLSLSFGSVLKDWPDKDFCSKCTMICLKQCNIPNLPEVLHCQELTMFHLESTKGDSSLEIPCNFFGEMKKLKVLDLTCLNIPLLPSSLQFLESLRTLCLDQCTLGDVALVGQLQNLEILSFQMSKFKELPKEIAQLKCLRLLDLTDCSQLEMISPNVLSSLKRLEHLGMRNSFNRWEAAGGVITTEESNVNLEELKHLPQLTVLHLHIPDANILPPDLFTGSKLERFQICIGSEWKWDDVDVALNTLKLQLSTNNELDQGLKMLLKRTEDLHLEGTEGVKNKIFHELATEGYQRLKHLHVQNNVEFVYTLRGKVGFPNLTWLAVSELNGLRFLLSTSMARSLSQLKRLQISGCQIMEEIVKMEESNNEIVENIFCQLQELELKGLPNLTKFCSRSCIALPNASCERLQLEYCAKSNAICEEAQEIDSKGKLHTVIEHFLFDNKVEFPRLKSLSLKGLTKLTTIWHSQFSQNSFSRLKNFEVHGCGNLVQIFGSSTVGRLNALGSLLIKECKSLEVLFELGGMDIMEEHYTSAVTQSKPFDCENLNSVEIGSCESLKNIFPAMVARRLQSLRKLIVTSCGVEEIVAKEEGLQATPKFVFPKVTKVIFDDLSKLTNFYPEIHVSSWPFLSDLEVRNCEKVDIFVEEISSFQEKHEVISSNALIGRQSLFLVDKDSFPNLETLVVTAMEFSNSSIPAAAQLFRKLKKLDVCCPQSKSTVFLEKLFKPEGINSSCNAVGRRTQQQHRHLKELRLTGMYNLMHLGQDDEESNSQSDSGIQNFPYLEILDVKGCDKLRSLRSSAISFDNLTTLQVSSCQRLKYLLTYSTAKSLMQLTKLEVVECPRLVEIVGSDEDGDSGNEITFRRLKHLKLSALPRFQGFCFRNCIAKFSSLETSSMSKGLKMKIFPAHDETLMLTDKEKATDLHVWEEELNSDEEMNSATSDLIS